MIKAGIFDVGGVLHDSAGAYLFSDISATLGIDIEQVKKAWDKPDELLLLGKITEAEFWQLFITAANVKKPLPKESLLLRAFIKHYGIHQDVIEIVRSLKKNGYKTAVLSNTILPHAQYQYDIGIYQNFDVVVLSHEVGLSKPDPEIFHLTLKKLNIKPEEAFFVDDLEKNITAAKELGMHAILYQTTPGLLADLKKINVNF